MSGAAILARGAVSAMGEGREAASAGVVGEPARVVLHPDVELMEAGLQRPFAARVAIPPGFDRAAWLLTRALSACAAELDGVRPAWRAERVGLVLGTSSGGMRGAERAFARLAAGEPAGEGEGATYFGPMARAVRALGVPASPAMLVLGACASSVLALGLGVRALEHDACDIVLAGGFDDVTVFVAAGFEVLRATTARLPPRPFRTGRDGMALGEGAGVLALGRVAGGARVYVTGFGAASDAQHLTAPDRDGAGLTRAAAAALAEAGGGPVDLVSPHATATPFNDPAEARAIAAVTAGQPASPVVHPFKAQIGHTLGAAGALEALACVDAIERGVLPAAAGDGPLDPEAPARLLDRAVAATPRTALKLACAFGGANAALVLADRPSTAPRRVRPVYVHAVAVAGAELPVDELAALTGVTADRLARSDALVRLALASVGRLAAASPAGSLRGAGVVVGTASATIETNALFAARIRERGARAAEPRRFAYTSPNAVAGECSIAFALTGPSFAVGGGLHAGLEALVAGSWLVGAGDADAVVVVAVDDAGPATRALLGEDVRSGAVALLLSAAPAGAWARLGPSELTRGRPASGSPSAGHRALLPLVARPSLPAVLACASAPDASARVELLPV
ncbi:MAG TPA: beta-ketoacyl synthase N-terminal-like domain-containing protein [Polyangiaceae bacterium]